MDTNQYPAEVVETSGSKKLIIGIIIVLVVLIGGYFYYQNRTVQPVSTEPIKIGFIGPLTGDVANLGQNAKLAVEMAIDEINSKGGINGSPIKVIYEDTKCNPSDGVNAGNKLINIDKVPVIIGGVCSSESLAVAPLAESSKTILFPYCASVPAISDAGDYIFRDYPSDSFQGKFLAEYMYNNGIRKTATLYCLSDYCIGLRDTFSKRFKELGGSIVLEEGFEQTARDLRTQLIKIKNSEPDAVYFSSYTEATIPGLKQAKEMGLNVEFFGADAWDDPKIWSEVGEIANSAIFTTVAPGEKSFKEKFMSKTGKNDMTICAPQAYDAVNIIADIMKKVGVDTEKIKNELYSVKNYKGVSGTIGFDEKGDLMTANYILKIVKNGQAIKYTQ